QQTMRTATEGARRGTPRAELLSKGHKPAALVKEIVHWLDEAKGEEGGNIDLKGKSSIGDFMVIVTGRSDRHVGAIAELLQRKLKEKGRVRIEGLEACDWVL